MALGAEAGEKLEEVSAGLVDLQVGHTPWVKSIPPLRLTETSVFARTAANLSTSTLLCESLLGLNRQDRWRSTAGSFSWIASKASNFESLMRWLNIN